MIKKTSFFITIFCLFFTTAAIANDKTEVKRLMDAVDDLYRSTSSHGKASMKVVTKHYSRTLEFEEWSKGKERSLIRILSPKKEKGTSTLKVETEIWNYLPKVNRIIKVPSSMMSAGWMGSHFTNDDLVKEARYSDDFECQIAFKGIRNSHKIIDIECTPHEDAVVTWGRVDLEILAEKLFPLKIKYLDEDMNLARTLLFENIAILGGKEIPTKLRMIPADKENEQTVFTYTFIEFDTNIPDKMFSLRALKHGR